MVRATSRTVAHRHRVDRDVVALGGNRDHHLEQIRCGIRADDGPAVWVFPGVFNSHA
jgi:hypothetical protein